MSFPTDSITLGRMRAEEPRLFALERIGRIHADQIDSLGIHCWELRLAERAYAKVLGLPDPMPRDDRRSVVEMLNRGYKQYGLSSGIQNTWQLVRDFEARAVERAERARGFGR